MQIKNVAVIGGGTMGTGIAHVFALNGFGVNLVETSRQLAEKAVETIDRNLQRMIDKEKIDNTEKKQALNNIDTFTSINKGVADVELVVEAVPENFDLKSQVFKKVEEAASEKVVFATNTSSISITKLAAETDRPEQFIGMHFFNPVPLMPLLELVKGLETSEETYSLIEQTAEQINKTPVAAKDAPGFVSNRVLMPMINEAIFCVHEGIAEPQDVDTVMKLGMNHPMGPLRLADFIGLDVCLDIMNVLYNGFKDSKYRPCPLLVKMVDAGKLGDKTGQGFYEYE